MEEGRQASRQSVDTSAPDFCHNYLQLKLLCLFTLLLGHILLHFNWVLFVNL